VFRHSMESSCPNALGYLDVSSRKAHVPLVRVRDPSTFDVAIALRPPTLATLFSHTDGLGTGARRPALPRERAGTNPSAWGHSIGETATRVCTLSVLILKTENRKHVSARPLDIDWSVPTARERPRRGANRGCAPF
jgi:hypothetical protein